MCETTMPKTILRLEVASENQPTWIVKMKGIHW